MMKKVLFSVLALVMALGLTLTMAQPAAACHANLTVTSDGCCPIKVYKSRHSDYGWIELGTVDRGGSGYFDIERSWYLKLEADVGPCCEFVNWTWTGDITIPDSTDNPDSWRLCWEMPPDNVDMHVTGYCHTHSYTLTTNVSPAEAGCVSGGGEYECCTSVEVEATPAECWYFTGWSGDLSGEENPTTIHMDGDKTVTANFSAVTPVYGPVYGGPVFVVPVLMSIRVTPEEATIAEGETQRFRAVASYSGGTTRNVTAEATWVSSDNNVATVYSGLATGVAEGTTSITATLGGETSNEATLSVTAPVVVSVEVAPESGTIGVGDTVQFTATATYSDGSNADVTAEATWVSSNNDVATVDAGLATGVAEGSAEIRATFDGVMSNAATLSVTTVAVVSIEVALESDTIGVGDTVQLTSTATYSDGTIVDITGQATWNSSDTDVATINAEGLATGEGAGTAEITATLDGVTSDPVTLTVTAAGAALQWWAILAIVAGSLALALLLFTMLRRRRGLATEGS